MKKQKKATDHAIKKLSESDHDPWDKVVPGLTFEELLTAMLGPDDLRGNEELQAFARHRDHGRGALSHIQDEFLMKIGVLEEN